MFVTGLSAGGAMTSVMLACYPEVFAGGAIIAGLPYGAATNVQQAFESMYQCPPRPAREWGDLVRSASPHRRTVAARLGLAWQRRQDRDPVERARDLKQWTDVHGLPVTPSTQARSTAIPAQVWINEAGEELIESYTITHMAHGTPLATGEGDDACGAAGPFLLEVGISSSYHIAKFFGLTGVNLRHADAAESKYVALSGRHDSRPSAALAPRKAQDRARISMMHHIKDTFRRPLPSRSVR